MIISGYEKFQMTNYRDRFEHNTIPSYCQQFKLQPH